MCEYKDVSHTYDDRNKIYNRLLKDSETKEVGRLYQHNIKINLVITNNK